MQSEARFEHDAWVGPASAKPVPISGTGRRGRGAAEHDRGGSIAEVILALGAEGYVRRFEQDGTRLWCRSSDTSFDPSAVTVERAKSVGAVTVLGLRDTVTGTGGTLIIGEVNDREARLLALLDWATWATPARVVVDRWPPRPDHRSVRSVGLSA